MQISRILRFFDFVEITETCWLWKGGKSQSGYGRFWFDRKLGPAHRFSYEYLNGPIPEGLQPDHLCRVKLCVNPDHIEIVTPSENSKRAIRKSFSDTHCKRGHEWTKENTRYDNEGYRRCRKCHQIIKKESRHRVRKGINHG